MRKLKYNSGFAIYIAIAVVGTLLIIVSGVIELAVKQAFITNSITQSQQAFYAADTGLECALYWDVKNPTGDSAFDPNANATDIHCNQGAANLGNHWFVGNAGVSTIGPIYFQPNDACAVVKVTKDLISPGSYKTTIESKGYNTCDPAASRRVERAVRAVY